MIDGLFLVLLDEPLDDLQVEVLSGEGVGGEQVVAEHGPQFPPEPLPDRHGEPHLLPLEDPRRQVLGARLRSLLRLKFATDALEESYRKLRELEKVRDDLMKMIVHDLKTPLTAVLAGLEMVIDGDFGPLNDGQRQVLGDAVRSLKDPRVGFVTITSVRVSRDLRHVCLDRSDIRNGDPATVAGHSDEAFADHPGKAEPEQGQRQSGRHLVGAQQLLQMANGNQAFDTGDLRPVSPGADECVLERRWYPY